jgi:methylmalonyl-CoA mutase N-terminal domain/subunit
MRFHTQTAGSTLTAQQPENNVIRTAIQALSAVLGGTQSLHTNAWDEALALPTDQSARTALRTQQVIAYESGVAGVVDPLAGSYYVEATTDALEAEARALIEKIDDIGGAVAAIEAGFVQRQIEESAYEYARAVETGAAVVVGVNRFVDGRDQEVPVVRVAPEVERAQVARLQRLRAERDGAAVDAALRRVEDTARGDGNLLYPMREALEASATLGEISDTLRGVFGTFEPGG